MYLLDFQRLFTHIKNCIRHFGLIVRPFKDSSKKIERCKYESDRKDSSAPKYYPHYVFHETSYSNTSKWIDGMDFHYHVMTALP